MWKKSIAFAWGWTWWHIFPIKSLIDNIDKNIYQIYWFWNKNSLEEKICKQIKDITFIPIISWKIRRQITLKNIRFNIIDLFKNLIGFFQSFFYVLKYKPSFIFSKWWYVAFMPCLAWKILRKKIYVHESDTVPWLVNKLIAKFSDQVFLWFKECEKFIKNKNKYFVWQIISNKFFQPVTYKNSNKTNLLIIWGSQWAKFLIDNIKPLIKDNFLKNFKIYIIGWVKNSTPTIDNKNVNYFGFLSQDELIEIYKKIDISITRWSATSLAEQDQFDIKKIIIPLPYTWWNHQYYNAVAYKKKWDILISQFDKNFQEKLKNNLLKFKNYKKKKGTYKSNKDNKKIVLNQIL